jgi:hypothetical protein
MIRKTLRLPMLCLALFSCARPDNTTTDAISVAAPPRFDLLIENGTVYDGSGGSA